MMTRPQFLQSLLRGTKDPIRIGNAFSAKYSDMTPSEAVTIANYCGGSSSSSNRSRSSYDADDNSSSSKGIFGDLIKNINDKLKVIPNLAEKYYRTQIGQSTSLSGQDEDSGSKILELFKENGLNPIGLGLDALVAIQDELLDQLTRESELKSEINSKTTLTLKLSEDLREDILASSIKASKYGFTLNELGELYSNLVEKSGKFGLINKETMDLASPVARSLTMSMQDLAETINEFEKVGTGANDTLETIFDVGRESMALGLSGKVIVADLQKNIGKLNEYGFKKGIDGLADMVRKSTAFRISMEESFKIADKVMSPEGALELSANLQVLGGAIGDFNDPLKLMYMATNNVEGLQDALIGAAGSLATYNTEQGRFEITGINLRKGNEMATQLGIRYSELAKGAIASAERTSAAFELMSSGLDMKPEDKELLTNLSRMEKGEMVIKIPKTLADEFGGKTEIKLSQMTDDLVLAFTKNADEIRGLNPEEMARAQLTSTQNSATSLKAIETYYRIYGGKAFRGALQGTGLEDKALEKYLDINASADRLIKKDFNTKFQQNVRGNIKNTGQELNDTLNDDKLNFKEKAVEMFETIKDGFKNFFESDKILHGSSINPKRVDITVTPSNSSISAISQGVSGHLRSMGEHPDFMEVDVFGSTS